jgi:hypothetical protein
MHKYLLHYHCDGGTDGRPADGQMGRWADGQMGRWADGQMGKWSDGQMDRMADGQMGRWADEHKTLSRTTLSITVKNATLGIMTFSIITLYNKRFYAECHLC